jgi:cytoskeletal protein RodZ
MATVHPGSVRNGHGPQIGLPQDGIIAIGELLRRARERRGLTLQEIARETKLPQRHLEALENDNLAVIPAGFYQRAEIRTYARAVGLDQDLLVSQLDSVSRPAGTRGAVRDSQKTATRARPRASVLIALVVIAVAAIVFGRAISVRTPATEPRAEMRGVTDSSPETGGRVGGGLPDLATFQREQELPLPASAGTAGAVAVSGTDVPVTAETDEARPSVNATTELVVSTEPAGAGVTVNGIGWGVSPVTIRNLPPGDKRIRVTSNGYTSEERLLRLTEGQRQAITIRLNSAP